MWTLPRVAGDMKRMLRRLEFFQRSWCDGLFAPGIVRTPLGGTCNRCATSQKSARVALVRALYEWCVVRTEHGFVLAYQRPDDYTAIWPPPHRSCSKRGHSGFEIRTDTLPSGAGCRLGTHRPTPNPSPPTT